MKIKKIGYTVPKGQIVNQYNEDDNNTYGCGYINGEVVFSGNEVGNITLSEPIENFKYCEIFYNRANNGHTSTKIEINEDSLKSICLMTTYYLNNIWRLYSRNIKINGTSLTNLSTNSLAINLLAEGYNTLYDDTNFQITKIVCYGRINTI